MSARSSRSTRRPARRRQDQVTLERFPTREEVDAMSQDRPAHVDGPHLMFDHFPSREELRGAEARLGIIPSPDSEITWRRFERHLDILGLGLADKATLIKPW